MQIFLAILQAVSLLVLAVTVYVSFRQLKAATAQAKASSDQAKSSEKMAQLALDQTELMRKQVHASFRPVVVATGASWESMHVKMTLENTGIGPALGITVVGQEGNRQALGTLSAGEMKIFEFDFYAFNLGRTPARFEYESVSGTHCWTTTSFTLGTSGPIGIQESTFGADTA